MTNNITSTVTYKGSLRTECQHLQSGNTIITDAPVDNRGKGEAFSPTDTVATGLANCMMTIMGIRAQDAGIDIVGTAAEVTKIMSENPRRIAEIVIRFKLPADLDDDARAMLEDAAYTSPVALSLHPETKQTVIFEYQ